MLGVGIDPKVFAFGEHRRIEPDGVAYSHSGFEHQFEQEPERLRVFGVPVGSAVQLESFGQDLVYLFIGVRFLLIVDGPVCLHLVHKGFCNPSAPVCVTEETAQLGHSR